MANAHPLTAAAERCLGVDDSVPAATTFLRRLDEAEGMPSQELVEAAGLLGVIACEGAEFPALEAWAERHFVSRLDEFVGGYWDTAPAARHAEWAALMALAGHLPKYRHRLEDLRAGVALTLPADADPLFDPLLRGLEVAFLLPTADRAGRLAAIRQKAGVKPTEMRLIADAFAAKWPAFGPALRVLGLDRQSAVADAERRARAALRRRVDGGRGMSESRKLGIVIVFVCCFVGGLMRAGCSGSSSSSSQPVTSPTTIPGQFGLPRVPGVDHEALSKILGMRRRVDLPLDSRMRLTFRWTAKELAWFDMAMSRLPKPFHEAVRLKYMRNALKS